MKTKVKSGDLVLPGDTLGISEEFIPLHNTYEENGKIKSLIVGRVLKDYRNKTISVMPCLELPPILKKNTHVIGEVIDIKEEKIALVRLLGVKGLKRPIFTNLIAGIYLPNVQRAYLNKMSDAFHIGDIVEAKIHEMLGLSYISLRTVEKDLGVIRALCTKCRNPMAKIGRNLVKCTNCGNIEKRKLSINYIIKGEKNEN